MSSAFRRCSSPTRSWRACCSCTTCTRFDPDARIRRALGHLGVGAEFLGIDDAGVVEVRLGHGCGSMTAVVEQVVTDAAPETTGVRVPAA